MIGYQKKPNTATSPALNLIHLNVPDIRSNLTAKSIEAFKYVYNQGYASQFDWFLKADDDTYVVMENLKHFLYSHCLNESHTYGYHFHTEGVHYHSGGGGYVMNRFTLDLLGQALARNSSFCSMKSGNEDMEVSIFD